MVEADVGGVRHRWVGGLGGEELAVEVVGGVWRMARRIVAIAKLGGAEVVLEGGERGLAKEELLDLVIVKRFPKILKGNHSVECLLPHEALKSAQLVIQEEVMHERLLQRSQYLLVLEEGLVFERLQIKISYICLILIDESLELLP